MGRRLVGREWDQSSIDNCFVGVGIGLKSEK